MGGGTHESKFKIKNNIFFFRGEEVGEGMGLSK